jgi:hypothetical protein
VKALTLWVVCAVVLFARRPDLLTNAQFFAEDGEVFFRDALLNGLASLPAPYAGYHHFVPRAIALLFAALPAVLQPAFYAWLSIASAAACCALLAPLLRGVIPDAGLRACAALGVAAAIPSNEIIGSVASLQWYLHLPILVAALVALPARAQLIARIAAVVVGATTPQGLIVAPVAAFLWWRRRPGHDPWVATSYAGASLLNVVTSPPESVVRATAHAAEAVGTVLAFRVGDSLVLGKQAAEMLAATATGAGIALGLILIAGLLVALAWRRGASAAVFAYAIVAPVALVLATRSFDATDSSGYGFFGADRYFIAPCAGVVVAVAALASTIRAPLLARAAAVIALSFGTCANFHEPQLPPDEHWTAAAPALDEWRAERDRGAAAAAAVVVIPPDKWAIALPACGAGGYGGAFPSCASPSGLTVPPTTPP